MTPSICVNSRFFTKSIFFNKKKKSNAFRIKKANYIFEELSNLYFIALLISLTKLLKLFIWTVKSGGTHHHKQSNCAWSIMLVIFFYWKWFLHYFRLLEYIHSKLKNLWTCKKFLQPSKCSLHLKNPLGKNIKRWLVRVPFSLGSLCKYWTYVIDHIGVSRTLSNV